MAKRQLVLAFFDSETTADEAVAKLKQWDKANKQIKLGGIGVLVKDDKGKIKTHKLGKRNTKTGAVIGAVAGVLSGGVTVIGGAIVGGILGSFFRKGLGLTKDDLNRIDGELNGGKAAVCVLAKGKEAEGISAKLAKLGGKPEVHDVTEDALDEALAAAESEPEAAPAEEVAAA